MAEPWDTYAETLAASLGVTPSPEGLAACSALLQTMQPTPLAQLRESMTLLGRWTGAQVISTDGPPSEVVGSPDSIAIDLATLTLYGPKDAVTGWGAGRSLAGANNYELWVALPGNEGLTEEDYFTWLANAQIEVVQPLLDAAEAAADAAAGSATAAAGSAVAADASADAGAASATAADGSADAAAASAAAADTSAEAANASAATATTKAAEADGSADAAAASATAADTSADAAAASATTATTKASEANASADAATASATAAAGAATAADASADAAAASAASVAGEAAAAASSAADAQSAQTAAEAAQAASEAARDEAEAIVGGDYLTEAEAAATYRALATPVPLADVSGLSAALAAKPDGSANPSQAQAEVGTDTTPRVWSAQRVWQAITAKIVAMAGAANGLAQLGSDGKLATAQIPDALLGALRYQSAWNAATNSPAIPTAATGNKGWYYVVTTAGATSLDGITDWKVGDWLISNGSIWQKIDNTDQVVSVAGLIGAITAGDLKTALSLTTADISGLIAALAAKLDLAGGVMTGLLRLAGFTEKAAAYSAGAIDARGSVFDAAISGTTTISLTNMPSSPATGETVTVHGRVTITGTPTITWISGTKWPGGVTPTISAGTWLLTYEAAWSGSAWVYYATMTKFA